MPAYEHTHSLNLKTLFMHYVSYYRLGYQTAIIKLSNERLFDIYNNGYVNYFYPLTIVRHTRMNQQLIFFLLRNKAEK